MSAEQLATLHLVAMQFHLLVCDKRLQECSRCKAALLAAEQLQAKPEAVRA